MVSRKNLIADLLGDWSGLTNVIGLIGVLFLLRYQTGLGTGISVCAFAGLAVVDLDASEPSVRGPLLDQPAHGGDGFCGVCICGRAAHQNRVVP